MNATQANNLRLLIQHMETKVTRTLYMESYTRCGSPACALGEAEAIGLIPSASREHVTGEAFDCIDARIFSIACLNPWQRTKVTPQEWAVEARKVLTKNGYSMESDFDRFMAKVREPVSLTPESCPR